MTLIGHGHGEGFGPMLRQVVFSGPIVAYLSSSFGVDTSATSLTVADVEARRVLRNVGEVGKSIDAGFAGSERVTKLVLGPEGAVAWITAVSESGRPGQAPQTYVLHAAATVGELQVLDEGPDIGGESLTLAGRTLHWWHAGIERSALLP